MTDKPCMTDKQSLRVTLRAARSGFAGAAIAPSDAFCGSLSADLVVASYIPVGGEADPALFVHAARKANCVLALPFVVDRATPLRFLQWTETGTDGSMLTDGPFGLRQPDAGAAAVTPDIILTPLLGFDRRGNRIGQGAGHYDRAFLACPAAWRIGLAWSIQEIAAIMPDPWDVPLHVIATEQEWITP